MPFWPVNHRMPFRCEGRRVEVGVAYLVWQWITPDLFCLRVDADNGVEVAVGDPGQTIGSNHHPVWSGAGSERDMPGFSCCGIEAAKSRLSLSGVPHGPVGRRCDIVWTRPGWNLVFFLKCWDKRLGINLWPGWCIGFLRVGAASNAESDHEKDRC